MADKGDVRLRAIAELALAVETGGDVGQAAYLARLEPYEIAELRGLPMRRGGSDIRGIRTEFAVWSTASPVRNRPSLGVRLVSGD